MIKRQLLQFLVWASNPPKWLMNLVQVGSFVFLAFIASATALFFHERTAGMQMMTNQHSQILYALHDYRDAVIAEQNEQAQVVKRQREIIMKLEELGIDISDITPLPLGDE